MTLTYLLMDVALPALKRAEGFVDEASGLYQKVVTDPSQLRLSSEFHADELGGITGYNRTTNGWRIEGANLPSDATVADRAVYKAFQPVGYLLGVLKRFSL